LALQNLCLYAARELRHVALFYPADVAGLAWAARNLFELNLIVRHVLSTEENFRSWLGQAIGDEQDFLSAVLAYADYPLDGGSRRAIEQRRLALAGMAERHRLQPAKPFRVQALAAALGEQEEYGALFKLFSKYVHPSSLYINAYAHTPPEISWLNVFLVKAQFYAGDTIGRISQAVGLEAPSRQ
jgi:hypothetical protein